MKGCDLINICGAFTHGTRKPCKHCKHFLLWGICYGLCTVHDKNMHTSEHCKYFKRDSQSWTKDGRPKFNMIY